MERQVPLGGMVGEGTLEVTWMMARSQPCEGQGVRELPGRGTTCPRQEEGWCVAGAAVMCFERSGVTSALVVLVRGPSP